MNTELRERDFERDLQEVQEKTMQKCKKTQRYHTK